ncbi:hypothetical protein RyT2_04140 [Pseudolactococcus yaeyamensis]
MKTLISAELYKILKNKLTYVGLVLTTIPILISFCFIYAKESFSLDATNGEVAQLTLFEYITNISFSLIWQIFIFLLFLVLYINTYISDEIKTDKIIYQIIGPQQKKRIFMSKLWTTVLITLTFLLICMLMTGLGYQLFIVGSEYFSRVSGFSIWGIIVITSYNIIYYVCLMLVIASLSFIKKGNAVLVIIFITNLLSIQLTNVEKIARWIPGCLVYDSALANQGNIIGIAIFQVIYLVAITGVIVFMAYRNFQKREF